VSVLRTSVIAVTVLMLASSLVGCSASLASVGQQAITTEVGGPPHPIDAPAKKPAHVVNPVCAKSTPFGVNHIYVSISKQYLWACTGAELVVGTSVTTGASALKNVRDATPLGTWRIYAKVRNTVLAGRDANGSWYDHVKYWMPFWEGYGFHDASWQTFSYGSSLYKTKGSHGCVHVPLAALTTIYNWAAVGTLVTIRG
jgi:hypothetical protein